MTIQIIKLTTGEELIGDVESKGDYVIKQPCAVQMMMSRADASPSMSLIPYAFYVDKHTVTIPKQHVIWIGTPIDEMYNQYNKIFGTGIQLAGV